MTLLVITRTVIGFGIVFMTCLAAEVIVMRARARWAGRTRRRGQAATNLQLPGAVIEMLGTPRNPIGESCDGVDAYEAEELEQLPIMPRAPKVYSGGGFRGRSRADPEPSQSPGGRARPRRGAPYAHFVSVAAGTVGILVFLISLHRMSIAADGDAHTGTHTLNIGTAGTPGNAGQT